MCRMKLVKRTLRPVQHLKNLTATHSKLAKAIERLHKFSIENDDLVEDISGSNFGHEDSTEGEERENKMKVGNLPRKGKVNGARKACGASITCNDMQLQSMSPAGNGRGSCK